MIAPENEINELAKALAQAQGEIEDASKDATNPHFKSQYATLASVREAIRKPLSVNGLSYVQLCNGAPDGSSVTVTTILMHASGQSITGTLMLPTVKRDPQGIGSALTYARRYALMGMVGIAAEDDDGNKASGKNGNDDALTEDQIEQLQTLLVEVDADIEAFLKYFRIEAVRDLPSRDFDRAISALNKKRKADVHS